MLKKYAGMPNDKNTATYQVIPGWGITKRADSTTLGNFLSFSPFSGTTSRFRFSFFLKLYIHNLGQAHIFPWNLLICVFG
jgi:hypothetical protein